MEKKKYRLKGHESFVIRDGWITKGLKAVSLDSHYYSVNSGADALGVGSNMAKSIRYWLKATGLTKENVVHGATLTEIGQFVKEYDLYLEDVFTLWIMHSNIICDFNSATSWNLFFNDMDLTSAFSREEMNELLKTLIIEKTGDETPSERSIRDDCAAILSMYGKNSSVGDDPEEKRISPFEELGLIGKAGNKYIKRRPNLDKINELIILYLIIDKLNEDKNIPIDYLSEGQNMPGKVLNLNRIAINDFLDKLQNRNLITVNRTAGLDIIYPAGCADMSKAAIVKEYFERKRVNES